MSGRFDDLVERMKAACLPLDSVKASVLSSEPYAYAGRREIEVTIEQPEFTSVCPLTGLPDAGIMTVIYVPRDLIVELKSLKLYLVQYRQVGVFYEHVVNRVLDDLVALLDPVHMKISIRFAPRGGITTTVEASHTGGG